MRYLSVALSTTISAGEPLYGVRSALLLAVPLFEAAREILLVFFEGDPPLSAAGTSVPRLPLVADGVLVLSPTAVDLPQLPALATTARTPELIPFPEARETEPQMASVGAILL